MNKTYLHMKNKKGYPKGSLILTIKGKDASKEATAIQNEMKKLGMYVELRRDERPIKRERKLA